MNSSITWLGQGGFLLRNGDTAICVDPYLSDSLHVKKKTGFERLIPPPVQPEELPADLVICTHDHLDHLDPDTLLHMSEDTAFAGPDSCMRHFRELGIPEQQLRALNRGDEWSFGDLLLKGVFADHTEDSIGVIAQIDGVTVYITGDSLHHPELYRQSEAQIDIFLVCINGKLGNMSAQEAARLATGLSPRAAIPCHYGMFRENTEDPLVFRDCLNGKVPFYTLEPGVKTPLQDILIFAGMNGGAV